MDLKLEGKVAIVGGASQGIGFGIARTRGRRRQARDHRPAGTALRAAAEKIRAEAGLEALALQADCRRAEDCAAVVTLTSAHEAASTSSSTMTARRRLAISLASTTRHGTAIESNLMYVVRMGREAAPHMTTAVAAAF